MDELLLTLKGRDAFLWFEPAILEKLALHRHKDDWMRFRALARTKGVLVDDLEREIARLETDRPVLRPIADLLDETEHVEYVVQQLLPRGGLSLVAGDPKAGKSVLARNLLYRASRGEPFLDRTTTPGLCLYFALEEMAQGIRESFRRIGVTNENILIHVGPMSIERSVLNIKEAVHTHHPALVVVDPLFDAVAIEDANAYAAVNRALKELLHVARDESAHIMVLHHTNKSSEAHGARAILGSHALRGATDTNLLLTVRGVKRFLETENRYGLAIQRSRLGYDPHTDRVWLTDPEERDIEEDVLTAIGNSELSTTEVKKAVTGWDNGSKVVALNELVKKGVLERQKQGKVTLYRKGGV